MNKLSSFIKKHHLKVYSQVSLGGAHIRIHKVDTAEKIGFDISYQDLLNKEKHTLELEFMDKCRKAFRLNDEKH